MFDNLTKEIFSYSVIPAAILVLIILVLLLAGKKKDGNYFKYNYSIKILLSITIGLVLPLITGYTIWVFLKYINRGIVMSNMLYMVLLVALIISLVILLGVICKKLYREINDVE